MPARINCPYCGAAVSAEARYCDRCGTPLAGSQLPPSRRSTRTPRRIAVWAFVLILCLLLGVGLVGGYRFRAAASSNPTPPTAETGQGDSATTMVGPPPQTASGGQGTEEFLRSIVSISAKGESGSGFLIDDKGHVVTAQHVVRDATCVTVTDDNGTPHPGRVIRADESWDVALVLVPTLESWPTHLELGVSGQMSSGDQIYLMGSPKGGTNQALSQQGTFDRLVQDQRMGTDQRYYKSLQSLSGPTVIEGASGGPVVSTRTGKAVGIVAASAGPAVKVSYAVPIDEVADKLKQWLTLPSPGACTASPVAVHAMLATVTSLSGTDGVNGTDLADGVELALRDMQLDLNRVGYDISLKRYDDQSNPTVAGEKARQAAFDQSILGVIGSYGDATTMAVAQALRDSGMVMVAPTASADELTLQGWDFFNRMVASTRHQDQAAARFAMDDLQARSVFLLEDGTPEGVLHAKAFVDAAQVIGLNVAQRVAVAATTDLAELSRNVSASGAQVVYYAGRRENALRPLQGLRQAGVNLPFLGTDVLYDHRFDRFDGVYFTGLTVEATTMFQNHFESVFGKPTKGYAHYGYYAARAVLETLVRYGEANPGKLPDRKQLAVLIRQRGSPTASFDSTGENRAALIHVFEWSSGARGRYPELRAQLN